MVISVISLLAVLFLVNKNLTRCDRGVWHVLLLSTMLSENFGLTRITSICPNLLFFNGIYKTVQK